MSVWRALGMCIVITAPVLLHAQSPPNHPTAEDTESWMQGRGRIPERELLIERQREKARLLQTLGGITTMSIPHNIEDILQSWVRNYPSGTIGSTRYVASAMKVDNAGNVYVTGYGGTDPNFDYVTIKYNSSGTQQWVATYDGPGNSDDKATSIAIDASGNVYVTGFSTGTTTGPDYATIKYNSSGTPQWAGTAVRYTGQGGNRDDEATAITVDASGNVYVTGFSEGITSGLDYAAIKYNSSGATQAGWPQRYNGTANASDRARAIAVDGSGNVYVSGVSAGDTTAYDYATRKYNSSGSVQWTARYNNSPVNEDDEATALVVDGSGNVFVTGFSKQANFGLDIVSVKYNSSGVQQWAVPVDGGGDDYAYAMALDGSGNVYVTGNSITAGSSNFTTIRYTTNGVVTWSRRDFNFTGNSYDAATALVLDANRNVYVAGTTTFGGLDDFLTLAYDSSGVILWSATYAGAGVLHDAASGVGVDGTGAVYVTGKTQDPSSLNSIFTTVKFVQPVLAGTKVYLQGPYSTGSGTMNKSLRTAGTLATRFPGVAVPGDAVDSINLEIRNATTPGGSTVRAFAAAWLLTNGTIRTFNDTTKNYVLYDAPEGSYYMVVRHRNHLAVMSSSTVALIRASSTSWDFSTALTQAFNSGQIQIGANPRFGMIAGDGNTSGIVTAADANGVFGSLNVTGYNASDINLSNIVTAADANVVFANLNRASTVP